MNLLFGILWLLGAVGLFGYSLATGERPLTIRGLDISSGWLFLLLAAWNFVRVYSARVHKAEQQALRAEHEARLRQVRHRERPTEYDPNFDFSDKPAPPPAG